MMKTETGKPNKEKEKNEIKISRMYIQIIYVDLVSW